MSFPFRFRSVDGFTYIELLVGLLIAAAIFLPAYRFACGVLDRQARTPADADERDLALDLISRDIRCATDVKAAPFYFDGSHLSFFRSSPEGPVLTNYRVEGSSTTTLSRNGAPLFDQMTDWSFRFFDGESWTALWGWDEEYRRPTEGVRGLPLAVEVAARDHGEELRRVIPVMTTVIQRWSS